LLPLEVTFRNINWKVTLLLIVKKEVFFIKKRKCAVSLPHEIAQNVDLEELVSTFATVKEHKMKF
jgi:hypothetical protein